MKRFLMVGAAVFLAACGGANGPLDSQVVEEPGLLNEVDALYAHSYVVGIKMLPGESAAEGRGRLVDVVSSIGGEVGREFRYIPYLVANLPDESVVAAQALVASGVLAPLEKNDLIAPALAETRSDVVSAQFDALGFDGTGQVVAVLDTGVDNSHPFLQGRVVDEACFTGINPSCPNQLNEQRGPGAAAPCTDPVRGSSSCEHGTHVAGIAVGANDQMRGVAPGAGIMAVNIFGYYPPTSLRTSRANMIDGLEYVYSKRNDFAIAAVNMSLAGDGIASRGWDDPFGCSDDNGSVQAAVRLLNDAEIAVIASAGNSGNDGAVSHPACLPEVISVGSIDRDGSLSDFSNSAHYMDLVAPGEAIVSSISDNGGPAGYEAKSGTSMSAPFVAGAFAALRQRSPNAPVLELLGDLQSHSDWIRDREGYRVPKAIVR